jgi:PAS domain S-box-containing protein
MVFNFYSLLFLVTALVAAVGTTLAMGRSSSKGARELGLLLLSATIWSFVVFLESAATTLADKLILTKISYVAVVTTPVLYLVFVYRFIGTNHLSSFRKIARLMVVPVLVLVLAWTNEYHHLIWTSFAPIDPNTNLTTYHHGIGFFIGYLSYNYLLMSWSTFLLARFIIQHQETFRSQGWIILIASLCPWVASVFYMLDINIAEGFDLTPGSICLSGLLFIFAILKVRLLDLLPIAREALVENLREGILVLDDDNRIQDINQAARDQLGITLDNVLGEELHALRVRRIKLLEALIGSDLNKMVEETDRDAFAVYKVSKIPLKTKPVSRLVVIRDITETIEKQKEIQQSAERYQQLYNLFRLMADNMPDMLWAKDPDMRYIFVNKAICEGLLHATNVEEPLGRTMDYFVEREQQKHPENPDWFTFGRNGASTDQLVLNTGQAGLFDELGTIDGVFRYLDVRKAPILDEQGRMIGIVGSSRDVTLQKKAESELIIAKEKAEESDRLKTAFLANMSHEIRTPMNSILGFVSLMQDPEITKTELEEYVKAVKSGADRLLNTINDIIQLSMIDSGSTVIDNAEIDVAELYFVLYTLFHKESKGKNLELVNRMPKPSDCVQLVCDREKLIAICTNLLKNAIKYTREGCVEIGCTPLQDRIRFYVKDTGIGIPSDLQLAIFDRFVQADGSKTRAYEGSGLGLALSKAYVEMMGGRIWVESVPGEGSTFFFELPLRP